MALLFYITIWWHFYGEQSVLDITKWSSERTKFDCFGYYVFHYVFGNSSYVYMYKFKSIFIGV